MFVSSIEGVADGGQACIALLDGDALCTCSLLGGRQPHVVAHCKGSDAEELHTVSLVHFGVGLVDKGVQHSRAVAAGASGKGAAAWGCMLRGLPGGGTHTVGGSRQFTAGQRSHAGFSDQGDVSWQAGGGFDGWAGGSCLVAAAQCLERPPPARRLPGGLRLHDARRHQRKEARYLEPHEGFRGRVSRETGRAGTGSSAE